MKKYKLIKEYPGSPELGTIAEKNSIDGIAYTYAGKTIYEASSESGLFQKIISTQPEFWQEIVEKNYEILSYVQIISNRVYKKDKDGIFISDNMWSLSVPLESHSNIKIHSVKRLSDGEVFTIGDKIKTSMKLTISSFIIIDNELLINPYEIIGTISLNKVSRLKQPLFTTEDGVDIYDPRQKVFSVSECDFKLQDHQDYGWIMTRIIERKYHHFSTKEKAEKYIINNKPCLSIQDILNVYTWDKHSFRNSVQLTEKELKELVKQKLNK